MRIWMKKAAFLLVMIVAMMMPSAVRAEVSPDQEAGGQRVVDRAGLFTDDEIEDMEVTIASMRKTMNMDVVVMTTDNTRGSNSRSYADAFYEAGGYGHGKNHSGVLFMIDMDNRELYISTEGAMIRFLTDDRISKILDHVYEFAGKERYAEAANSFLADTLAYYHSGIPGNQYNYDTETGAVSRYRSIRWYEAALALVVSVGCGLLACLSVKRQYAMKAERRQAGNYNMAYRANSQFVFRDRNDILTKTFTAQRIIPRSTGSSGGGGRSSSSSSGRSSTHRSSSGRTHGGGGRKF